jgi:hypothetical protein
MYGLSCKQNKNRTTDPVKTGLEKSEKESTSNAEQQYSNTHASVCDVHKDWFTLE